MTKLLILIAVAFVMVSAAYSWMLRTYLPGAPLFYPFPTTPVLTVLELVIVVMTGVGVLGGFMGNIARVRTTTLVNVVAGVTGAGYGELNMHFGMLIDNVVTFATLAPRRLESLAILALGLFGAVLGLGILQLRSGVRRV